MERRKGGRVEGKKVERWTVGKVERWKVERWKGGRWKGGKVYYTLLYYTILYYTIVYYSILYYSLSNIRIQQRLLANYIPGDTHNLQRSTGYQFSSDRYYKLCYRQQYISGYDLNHLSKMFQKVFKVTLRMIALFEYSSQ